MMAIPGWSELLRRARDAWPELDLDDPAFAEHVLARVGEAELAAAPAADLALAWGCAVGQPAAHRAFDGILDEVDAAGRSTHAPRDAVAEVKQRLRVQLLVSVDGAPPGIAGYKGKGPLRGWLRITATRELVRELKKEARAQTLDGDFGDAIADGVADPLLESLKTEYRTEFAAALREAIAALEADELTLLRRQIVDGQTIDDLAAAYGVHRATAARWLGKARESLVAATHARLAARLAIPDDQIESVIRLVQSQLDASVVRYLRDRKPPQGRG